MSTMKAIVQNKWGDNSVLEEASVARPAPEGHDLLVRVRAVGINPIDFKKRGGMGDPKQDMDFENRILGWDASGVVEAVGADTSLYKPGDEVFFAGSLVRQGVYAEYALVDERIVGVKPKNVGHLEAATLPLVSLTGWEALEESLGLTTFADNSNITLLVINGAGGVGSMATQLAKKVFGVGKVITTASRDTTIEWSKSMGSDLIINHREPLKPQLDAAGVAGVDRVLVCVSVEPYLPQLHEIIVPRGKLAILFFDTWSMTDLAPYFFKSISFCCELMYTRPIFGHDLEKQKKILDAVSKAVDEETFKSVLTKQFRGLGLENVREALAVQETGKSWGKIAIEF